MKSRLKVYLHTDRVFLIIVIGLMLSSSEVSLNCVNFIELHLCQSTINICETVIVLEIMHLWFMQRWAESTKRLTSLMVNLLT